MRDPGVVALSPPHSKLRLASARGDIPVGPVELLIIQASPFCNIDCKYCYLPERSSTARISTETIAALVSRLRAAPRLIGDVLSISWHAGEPLTLPIAFYERAFATITEGFGDSVKVNQSMQTNATLVHEGWLDFFQAREVRLGVSLDGPEFLHDRKRVYRNGKGTHAAAMKGVRALQSRDIPFNVIAVVTDETVKHPDAFYDFFVHCGIDRVALNVEEVELYNTTSSMSAKTLQPYRAFLTRLFERSLHDQSVRFRELGAMRNVVLHDTARPHRYTQLVRPFGVVTCDHRGDVFSFSPELCGGVSAHYSNFVVGNVHSHDLEEMLASHAMQSMLFDIQAGIDKCEEHCGYFALCGGGTPANKFFEHGTFDVAETMHCQHNRKTVIDVTIEQLEQHVLRGRSE